MAELRARLLAEVAGEEAAEVDLAGLRSLDGAGLRLLVSLSRTLPTRFVNWPPEAAAVVRRAGFAAALGLESHP